MKISATFLHKCLAGFLIGVGFILPGVSGGVMAVSFGLYRPMLDAVTGFCKEPRRNALFLAPIALGGALGALLGAKALFYVMARWETPMLFLFIGFILAGLPGLMKEADGAGFRPRYLWALLPGLLLALPLLLAGGGEANAETLSWPQALLTGAAYAFGTVIPGVSTSFLLIFLGWYQAALQAVGSLRLETLLPMAVGFIAAALAMLKGVSWLFDRYRPYAYYGVLGFSLASVGMVYPGLGSGAEMGMNLAALALGLLLARRLNRMKLSGEE